MAHIRATRICNNVILTQLYDCAFPPMKKKKTNPEFNHRWTQMNADGRSRIQEFKNPKKAAPVSS
jgi:hypothetical protein